eukprot:TRINITY_DN17843_c0_g1_i2.p1 TRINITY_DN17843_c0_g1~~TRINITY_DN17843_c0_g1_i2.p1  ORF type:complete len:376 (+),score=33.56 TRINITY_DN17843_c0_g1_i2:116-1243(+)
MGAMIGFTSRWSSLAVCLMIWLRSTYREIMQSVGFRQHGRLGEYIFSFDTLFDLITMLLTLVSLVSLAANWDAFPDDQGWRLVFAIAGFFRWVAVLNSLRGFESTGKPMLPILHAVPATGPFFLVVVICLLGFLHMYYAFGLINAWDAMITMYRLGFLADFTLSDMTVGTPGRRLKSAAGVSDIAALGNATAEEGSHSWGTSWWWGVDGVFIVMSLTMSITLMNILIGVLSESYNRGWERRERLFLLQRSRIVLQHFTVREGKKQLYSCARRQVTPEDTSHRRDYVWFVRPRDKSEWGQGFDDDSNLHERVTELRRDLHNLREENTQNFRRIQEPGSDSRRLERLENTTQELAESLQRIEGLLADRFPPRETVKC